MNCSLLQGKSDPANVQITVEFGGEVHLNLVENQYPFILIKY